jgi:TMEM175 potassium channel family protein
VAFLPFPTKLVAEALHNESSERVFVTAYGLTLLAIRILGFSLNAYARHERLYSPPEGGEEQMDQPRELLPALGGYVIAILIGLVLPGVAVTLYFGVALFMILFRELKRHTSRARARP